MKKIILIRHAKSSWDHPWLADHDRPLAERGENDAPIMARRLKERGVSPDLILSSTALRAAETAKITAREFEFPENQITWEGQLFHASPNTLLKHIRSQHDSKQTMLVFGHNPGLNDLIEFLEGEIDNLPTSGQFGFKIRAESWAELKPSNAEVWFMDFPKKT
jgi:phosphohistidine phosphatase